MARPAIIYCRISRDTEGDFLGVARQERECRELAAQCHLDVIDVAIDDDISAYSGRHRPGYERVLDAIKNSEVQALVVWAPDRLHRRPIELEGFIDLVEATGCRIYTVRSGEVDLSNEDGRMIARITGAVARQESERKSARLRAKHRELAAAGKP
ncbi:MAG: recombinase family protein, partial [Acidimicrobiales bacterium]|nr:recombinase family protein [Acidimicrobiales bacterium]